MQCTLTAELQSFCWGQSHIAYSIMNFIFPTEAFNYQNFFLDDANQKLLEQLYTIPPASHFSKAFVFLQLRKGEEMDRKLVISVEEGGSLSNKRSYHFIFQDSSDFYVTCVFCIAGRKTK